MIKTALIALACTAGLSTAALAAGEDIPVSAANGYTRTANINIADLNLSEPSGKVELRSRVKRAVELVCASDAACNYTAEREGARLASNAIVSFQRGRVASAAPSHLTIGGPR